ncbi:hypothetical protein Tco_0432495 [Tanacetum coccineum]
MEDTLSKFMSESVKRHEENSNLIKEIRALTDAAIQNQGSSIKTLEIQIGQMSKAKLGFTTKLTVELADRTVKFPKGIAENVLVGSKKRGLFTSSLIKRVYMLSLRERMEIDLEAKLTGETLVINRSLNPLNGDYIELNDLNEPFELRRNQGDDLMPTIEEGEVIEEFKLRMMNFDMELNDY